MFLHTEEADEPLDRDFCKFWQAVFSCHYTISDTLAFKSNLKMTCRLFAFKTALDNNNTITTACSQMNRLILLEGAVTFYLQ